MNHGGVFMATAKRFQPRSLYFSDRLVKALDGMFDYPLTVVEAPMGYGKTIAVRERLHHAEVHVLWQSVYDGATIIFWSGFCKLFAGLDEVCSVNLAKLGLPDDSISRGEALDLIEEVKLPGKTVLVIDDYHLIQNSDIHDFLVCLVKNKIQNLHIVMITRLVPLDCLDELELKGYVHPIVKEDFALTPDEIAGYFQLCGITLATGQINWLYKYTEGWISALYLLMLKYIQEDGFEPEIPGVSLTPGIHNLVEKTIYQPLPAELRDFLSAVSVFDNFTREQAAYIWQKPNTFRLLAEVMVRNAFLAYDRKSKTYHLHNILSTYLREQVGLADPLYQQNLYQRAGQWYDQAGDYLTAMSFFYRCGDFDQLLEALEKDKAFSIDAEHKEILIRYFENCPPETYRHHPAALRLMGNCLFFFNEKEKFLKVNGEFLQLIEKSGPLELFLKNQLVGQYELMLAYTTFNDVAVMISHYRRAFELLQGASPSADLTASWAAYGCPSSVYLFYRESGKLEAMILDTMEALSYYAKATRDSGQATGHIMAAESHFLMGEYEKAEILLHKAFNPGSPDYRPGMRVRGLFLQIRLALVKGDFFAMASLLQRLRRDIHENKLYLFMYSLDLCEAFIYGNLGQKARIRSWITRGEFKKTRFFFPVMGFVNIVWGRVLLINGEYAKLIGNADYFIQTASFFPNMLGLIYTYIQLAAAYQQIHWKAEAFAAMRQALDIAMPDRVYLPFVENYDFIQPLLEVAGWESSYQVGIIKINELSGDYQKAVQRITKQLPREGISLLTQRELEIARLAAMGLTNSEIGARLSISPNTVKTQLKSIFRKVAITTRDSLKQCFEDRELQ
jgi:LuxR family transcriptional regulator, maltose regulon positive regulatory protein